ncbi:MAG TPA: polysaccharide deacetylase family protein [Thermoanaerobaculia bacterium]|nr:polysaccharide deacetylase family protein [Thermoanaerobaculia bacterium]
MSRQAVDERKVAEPTVVVSLHDVHLDSWRDYAPFVDELAERGVGRTSLLVVPHWRDRPMADDPEMIDWLRRLADAGHEIVLHGWRHRADPVRGGFLPRLVGGVYTAGEGEFYQLGYPEARRRLEAGRDELVAAGLPPAGFVAPAWLLSGLARRAVSDLGFPYTTYLHRFELLPEGPRHYAPSLVFSLRSAWRKRVSLTWIPLWAKLNARAALLRVAVHPIDLGDEAGRAAMLRLSAAAAARRRVRTYAELADELAAADAPGQSAA